MNLNFCIIHKKTLSLLENQKKKVEEEEATGMKDSESKLSDTKVVKICIVFTHHAKKKWVQI